MNRRAFLAGLGAIGATAALSGLKPILSEANPRPGISGRFVQQYEIAGDRNISRLDILCGAAVLQPRFALRVTPLSRGQRKRIRRLKARIRREMAA